MPQKIPRCVGVNRPFGSGEHGHQPESSLARMAHLAPEYWPTFWPELTTGHRRIRRKDRNVRDRRPADLMARGTPLHSWSRHATSRSRYRSWSSSRDDVGRAATTVPFRSRSTLRRERERPGRAVSSDAASPSWYGSGDRLVSASRGPHPDARSSLPATRGVSPASAQPRGPAGPAPGPGGCA